MNQRDLLNRELGHKPKRKINKPKGHQSLTRSCWISRGCACHILIEPFLWFIIPFVLNRVLIPREGRAAIGQLAGPRDAKKNTKAGQIAEMRAMESKGATLTRLVASGNGNHLLQEVTRDQIEAHERNGTTRVLFTTNAGRTRAFLSTPFSKDDKGGRSQTQGIVERVNQTLKRLLMKAPDLKATLPGGGRHASRRDRHRTRASRPDCPRQE
eukprot:SAG22_NODE_283_length_13027_cov_25.568535_4_plen_212_part_00